MSNPSEKIANQPIAISSTLNAPTFCLSSSSATSITGDLPDAVAVAIEKILPKKVPPLAGGWPTFHLSRRQFQYLCCRGNRTEEQMAIRLVITFAATRGKGGELAAAMRERCADVRKEPGCVQFEAFQSVDDPDRIVLLEHWADQAALDAHMKVNATRPPMREGLRQGMGEREDYTYNRTR